MEDLYLIIEAKKRLQSNVQCHSYKDVLGDCGLTIADVEAMDDVEIK